MKHYNKVVCLPDTNKLIYDYTELTEDRWFDDGKRIDGHGEWNYGEEPQALYIEVKYWSRDSGRFMNNGNRCWESAGIYKIAEEDKRELHRLLKIGFPNCEFRYKCMELLFSWFARMEA